ncbi:hypothetical protein C0995_008993 [Termitomyces sp. Mi166|nr:hypothetical protein C0995_008993 [Termitomyces sp. Mi166\
MTSPPNVPVTNSAPSAQFHTDSWLALEIGDLLHAKEMFNKLVSIHQDINVGVSTFYTFIHMLTLKWDSFSSMFNDHISAISAANAKLTAIKKQIDSEFLAIILLHSLPDKTVWETFYTTILSSITLEKALSFSELADCLTFTATTIRRLVSRPFIFSSA